MNDTADSDVVDIDLIVDDHSKECTAGRPLDDMGNCFDIGYVSASAFDQVPGPQTLVVGN